MSSLAVLERISSMTHVWDVRHHAQVLVSLVVGLSCPNYEEVLPRIAIYQHFDVLFRTQLPIQCFVRSVVGDQ